MVMACGSMVWVVLATAVSGCGPIVASGLVVQAMVDEPMAVWSSTVVASMIAVLPSGVGMGADQVFVVAGGWAIGCSAMGCSGAAPVGPEGIGVPDQIDVVAEGEEAREQKAPPGYLCSTCRGG